MPYAATKSFAISSRVPSLLISCILGGFSPFQRRGLPSLFPSMSFLIYFSGTIANRGVIPHIHKSLIVKRPGVVIPLTFFLHNLTFLFPLEAANDAGSAQDFYKERLCPIQLWAPPPPNLCSLMFLTLFKKLKLYRSRESLSPRGRPKRGIRMSGPTRPETRHLRKDTTIDLKPFKLL